MEAELVAMIADLAEEIREFKESNDNTDTLEAYFNFELKDIFKE